ncbi:MAG TPA: hypothetical protein VKA63_07140 [Candidatus Krumholzibacteria bacterium]|nr:hypothetical protein [Candidatus Krumholzibacteria bacterium]
MSLIKGGIVKFEVYDGVSAWDEITKLLSEGTEEPTCEPAPIGFVDGTEGTAGERLTAVQAVALDENTATDGPATLETAAAGLTTADVRWTAGDGAIITVTGARVTIEKRPITGFGGVTATLYKFTKTHAEAGGSYAIS